jgi:hypothetical protein
VAVCHSDGTVIRLGSPPAPPAAADLAVVDDAAVEDAA